MLQAQVDSGEVIPDDDQRQKIERAAALAQEIEDMRVQLEKTLEGPLEDGDGASDLHVEAGEEGDSSGGGEENAQCEAEPVGEMDQLTLADVVQDDTNQGMSRWDFAPDVMDGLSVKTDCGRLGKV